MFYSTSVFHYNYGIMAYVCIHFDSFDSFDLLCTYIYVEYIHTYLVAIHMYSYYESKCIHISTSIHIAISLYLDAFHFTCITGTFNKIGSIPLSPLSYNTAKPYVFNGTQPSSNECISIDGQVTTDCGQGTTLIDCDRGYNDTADYSDYFIWNRFRVSILVKFDQPINISRISMFFWNSPNDSILVENVNMYWADYSLQFDKIVSTTNSPITAEDGQYKLNINVSDSRPLKYQYLKIVMDFNNEWIFLSEVQFCGECL